jgi:hypothetical protein
MPFNAICPLCDKRFPLPDGAEGVSLKCPHCGYQSPKPLPTPPETALPTTPYTPEAVRVGCALGVVGIWVGLLICMGKLSSSSFLNDIGKIFGGK